MVVSQQSLSRVNKGQNPENPQHIFELATRIYFWETPSLFIVIRQSKSTSTFIIGNVLVLIIKIAEYIVLLRWIRFRPDIKNIIGMFGDRISFQRKLASTVYF